MKILIADLVTFIDESDKPRCSKRYNEAVDAENLCRKEYDAKSWLYKLFNGFSYDYFNTEYWACIQWSDETESALRIMLYASSLGDTVEGRDLPSRLVSSFHSWYASNRLSTKK